MNLLKDDIKKIYFRFLLASFGSALISSIYGLVDMAMVGQYHGPAGSAAMAIVSPIWNILYSCGLLTGIGGSVLYGVFKGKGDKKTANAFFTSSLILSVVISLALWALVFFWEDPLLYLFGCSEDLLPLCREYLTIPRLTVPVFVFSNFISAFLRNDGDPGLATASIVAGGVFNVIGDYLFVFVFDMGIKGAGIATTLCVGISLLVMMVHFFKKKNTLRMEKPNNIFIDFLKIFYYGFSTFVVDVAMGILTILFNHVIMRYLGEAALSVYGVIVNISTLIQCCAYGVGQAAQPIISENYGAGEKDRIQKVLKYSLLSSLALAIVMTGVVMAIPNALIFLFMSPTAEVLSIAPSIIRFYAISFLVLPFNVFFTYYYQAINKPNLSLTVSLLRGIVLSGILIEVLPLIFVGESVWFAMPITELLVFFFSLFFLLKPQKKENDSSLN